MQVSLIIPALNEAECIGALLAEVPAGLVQQVIVVDNGSTDNTGQVARMAGAIVVEEPRRGYGFACAAGAAAAKGEVLVFMDGDGSFLPAELPELLAPVTQGKADLVLGSRCATKPPQENMPPHQRFGNLLFTWFLRLRYGLAVTDLGPYRAIRRELLLALGMEEHTYGWPLEMIIKTARHHKVICEIPITFRPRFAGQSKVSGTLRGTFLTAYRFLSISLRYTF